MHMSRITLKQVAAQASVSVQTVSHILNDRPDKPYKQATRDRVLDAARKLGYRPNAAARSMVTQRTRNIGLVMHTNPEAWFNTVDAYEIMLGLNALLSPKGYICSMIPVGSLSKPGSESRIFREQVLDGVVVCGHADHNVYERIEQSVELCIWVDTDINHPQGCIRRDEQHNAYLAAMKLAELGYRKIIWMDYALHWSHYSHRDRQAGLDKAMRDFDLQGDTLPCTQSWIGKSPSTIARKLGPDVAVITSRHQFAHSLVHTLLHENLRPGYDYGLATLDISNDSEHAWPGLCSVQTDRSIIGKLAGHMFLNALENKGKLPDSVCLQGTWHAGDTAWGPR
ncbi:MAG: hypothetical protein CMJ19_11755 [Phycisphaeraceae bacterium]|nr:hypothetical protein [Phycisphaeraceae bacterium]